MKRYILLLPIILSACASNPTSPSVSAHPFLQKFKQVEVSFQNLPERSDYEYHVWGAPPGIPPSLGGNTDVSNISTSPQGGSMTFKFDTSTFKQTGNSIVASGYDANMNGTWSVTVRADQDSGLINSLGLSYHDEGGSGASGGSDSYGLSCQHAVFKSDSAGNVIVIMVGKVLQNELLSLGSSSSRTIRISSQSSEADYTGTALDSSAVTIRFIP